MVEYLHPEDHRAGLAVDRPNVYGGTVHHVHDGDTIYGLIWNPLDQLYELLGCRVKGTQAPELAKDPGAEVVRDELIALAVVGADMRIGNLSGYPRPGHVTVSVAVRVHGVWVDVASWLLDLGYAVPWDGKGSKPVVPWPPVPVRRTMTPDGREILET
jgi:hypothetical protein